MDNFRKMWFESESCTHPLVVAFGFHLAEREICLLQAFVPSHYTRWHSLRQVEHIRHIKANNVFLLSLVSAFASET